MNYWGEYSNLFIEEKPQSSLGNGSEIVFRMTFTASVIIYEVIFF
jgi:hypothetical protein